MNNYFNFNIPVFNQEYGSDWDDFNDVVEDNTDYVIKKTIDLYRLVDITRTPLQALNIILESYGIAIDYSDTIAEKKQQIRDFVGAFEEKGMEDFYLDPIEVIVGTRGDIYGSVDFGNFIWGTSGWPNAGTPVDTDWTWQKTDTKFYIYIDVKTEDEDELDKIVELLQLPYMRPAFYQIYLVNSTFEILRSI